MQTQLFSLLYAAVVGMAFCVSANAVADSKALPGNACDPQDNNTPHAKTSLGLQHALDFPRNYICPILREKTTTAPILEARLKVSVVSGTSAVCSIQSRRANGTLIQISSQSTSKGGINTLGWNNIITAPNGGHVSVTCSLPLSARIVSVFWNE